MILDNRNRLERPAPVLVPVARPGPQLELRPSVQLLLQRRAVQVRPHQEARLQRLRRLHGRHQATGRDIVSGPAGGQLDQRPDPDVHLRPPTPARPSSATSTRRPSSPAAPSTPSPLSPTAPTRSSWGDRRARQRERGQVAPLHRRHGSADGAHPLGARERLRHLRPERLVCLQLQRRLARLPLDDADFTPCSSPFARSGLRGRLAHLQGQGDGRSRQRSGRHPSTWTVDTVAPRRLDHAGPADGSTSGDPRPSFELPGQRARGQLRVPVRRRRLRGLHLALHDPRATRRRASTRSTSGRLTVPATWARLPRGRGRSTSQVDVWITSGLASGAITNNRSPGFRFSSSDSLAGFRCRMDGPGHLFHSCTSTPSEPYTPPTPLDDGHHMFSVKAVDRPDASDVVSRSFRVDTRAPKVTISSGPRTDRRRLIRALHSASPPTRRAPASSARSTGTDTRHAPPRTRSGPSPTAATHSRVRAIDAAGNRSARLRVQFTIDTEAPGLMIKGPREVKTRYSRASAVFDLKASEAVSRKCKVEVEGLQARVPSTTGPRSSPSGRTSSRSGPPIGPAT